MELLLSGFTLGIFVVLLIIGLLKLAKYLSDFKWTVISSSRSITHLFGEARAINQNMDAMTKRQESLERNEREYLTSIARLAHRYTELEAGAKHLSARVAALEYRSMPSTKRAAK